MQEDPKFMRDYNRQTLRTMFQSVFAAVLGDRKKREKLTQQQLADKLGIDKAQLSRYLNTPPNWTIDKMSDMAEALDIDLEMIATDRRSKRVFSAHGIVYIATAMSIRTPDQMIPNTQISTSSGGGEPLRIVNASCPALQKVES